MDENTIQHIKPLWNGFHKHWQLHLVDKLLKKMVIDWIQLHSMCHLGKNNSYIKEGKQIHTYMRSIINSTTINQCPLYN
jgi:hypothetical protein